MLFPVGPCHWDTRCPFESSAWAETCHTLTRLEEKKQPTQKQTSKTSLMNSTWDNNAEFNCWYSIVVHLCRQTSPAIPYITAIPMQVWLIHGLNTLLTPYVKAFNQGKGSMDSYQLTTDADLWSTSSDNLSSDRSTKCDLHKPPDHCQLQIQNSLNWHKPPVIQIFKNSCFDEKLLLTIKHSRRMSAAPGTATIQIIHGSCSDTQLVWITATPGKSRGQNPRSY